MVYAEYNVSKKQRTQFSIDVRESSTYIGYTLLPFAPETTVQPSNSIYPTNNLEHIESDIYNLLRFKAIKNYPKDKYAFKYNDNYYLFDAEIPKDYTLYFDIIEYEGGVTEPILTADGYIQMKEILPVYDVLELNKSGNELTFSNIKADYGTRNKSQLPMALQEIRIWEGELIDEDDLSQCKLLFTGYLDSASLTQKHTDEDECDIELTLLSPMNLATRRYVSINGTYQTDELFRLIFEPLINDGFNLKRINVNKTTISVNYYLETIETIMNDLSNKLNIYWSIDSKKNINIVDIIKLLGQEPKMTITTDFIEGLYLLKPIIQNNNYFNCINVKNARIYTSGKNEELLEVMKLVNGETSHFVNPIDFGTNGLDRVCFNNNTDHCTILTIKDQNQQILYEIEYDTATKQVVLPAGVVYSDGDTENATLILERDSFFKNLITGLQWKGSTTNITEIKTDSMLKYQLFRITNANEIYKCSQFITDSGIIETTIDVNESWFTFMEMVNYCNNLMTSNSNNTASVELAFDKDYDFEIGDTIRIKRPNFFIDGDFVITEIKEQKSGYDSYDCQIVAQNNKLQSNYIDIFRKSISEENEVKYNSINVIEYASDEILETYGVYED